MMTNLADTFFMTFLAVAILLTSLFLQRYRTRQHIKPSRLSRAIRRGVGTAQAPVDLPSIARQRFAYLKQSFDQPNFIIAFFVFIDSIICASGIKCSLRQFFLANALLATFLAVMMHIAATFQPLVAIALSVPLSILLSIKFLSRAKTRRLEHFRDIFPDALDLIVRSVRAGLPVSEAVKIIGNEISDPVGNDFREVAANLMIGMSLEESLLLLQKRVPIAEIKYFAISLTIQQETGGNLAEILSNLANIMRKRIQIRKKIRALSSEARASALIIGALPFIVGLAIFALNRDYIEVLFVDDMGKLFLGGAVGSIVIGGIVMSKMIRFDV
jgi:tight adherence protein B